jgi:hypothetical protein
MTSSSSSSRLLLSCLDQDVVRNIIHPMVGTSLNDQLQHLCVAVSRYLIHTATPSKIRPRGWKLALIKECLAIGYPSVSGKRVADGTDKCLPYHPFIHLQAQARSNAILTYVTSYKTMWRPTSFQITETAQLEERCQEFEQFVKTCRDIPLETWLGQRIITTASYTRWSKVMLHPVRGKKLPSGGMDRRLFSYMDGRSVYCEIFCKKYAKQCLFTVFEQVYTHANTILADARKN